jgi:hypothetical protein
MIIYKLCLYNYVTVTSNVQRNSENIREEFRSPYFCTSHFRGVAGLCRRTILLDNRRRYVQSTTHPPVIHQQINCHS